MALGEFPLKKGAPCAILTRFVLTVKKDAHLLPVQAKSSIVVVGNHRDRFQNKSEEYAPVFRSDPFRFLVSMTVKKLLRAQIGQL